MAMINSRAMLASQTAINSMGSVKADSDAPIDSVDNMSVVSDSDANDNNDPGNNDNGDSNNTTRRRRWKLFREADENNDGTSDNNRFKALSVTCRCKSAFQGSCLITCSSIIELVGNLLALVYGIAFIHSACNFYDIDTSSDKKKKEYDDNLERVLFLEKNRVGYVGLLATCLVGLIVSFLMPFGTIYKSWKSLRASMSLLFSICLAHVILASIYLHDHELMATLAVIPFRVYEILLIYNYISIYKKKKREEALRAQEANGALGTPLDSQNVLGSFDSINPVNGTGSQDNPITSDMQLSFNVNKVQGQGQAKQQQDTEDDPGNDEDQPVRRERKGSKKRRFQLQNWQEQGERERKNNSNRQPESYPPAEYK